MRTKLDGIFAPITTPFDENGCVMLDALTENIRAYNGTPLAGYMPLGSNGEFLGLTSEESFQILDVIQEHKAPGKTVVAGCGRESSLATIAFIREVHAHGVNLAFVLAPHYYVSCMTEEALEKYYFDIADHSPIPIVVYNAPKFSSGLAISPALLHKLTQHENIAGMKNSSGEPISTFTGYIPPGSDFNLLAGNISMLYDGILQGACGGVLSTASWLPEYCCLIYKLLKEQSLAKAQKLFAFTDRLSRATAGKYGVAGVKYGLTLRGLYGGALRLPLLPMSPGQMAQMKEEVEKAAVGPLPTPLEDLYEIIDA